MQKAIEHLLQNPAIRQANYAPLATRPGRPTGFPALDEILPGGGWPTGSLTEILVDRQGIGELSLLMPALAAASGEQRWLAWVSPPHIPYGPALAAKGIDLSRVLLIHARPGPDTLWAVEQALASGTCSSVLTWLDEDLDSRMLRRLQLAAESGKSSGFLFRPPDHVNLPSPAALRLGIEITSHGLIIKVLKCRGRSGAAMMLDVDHDLVEPAFSNLGAGYRQTRQLQH
jgi:hypothetical protein